MVALDTVLVTNNESLVMVAVQTLGQIPGHEATELLTKVALLAPWPQVTTAAIQQLKQRPIHEYVPALLAQLDTPIQLINSPTRINGTESVTQQQVLIKEGMNSNQMLILNSVRTATPHSNGMDAPKVVYRKSMRWGDRFEDLQGNPISKEETLQRLDGYPEFQAIVANSDTTGDAMYNRLGQLQSQLANRTATEATSIQSGQISAAAIQQAAQGKRRISAVSQENARIAMSNSRVFAILREATGQVLADKATTWWDWWHDYNEVSSNPNNDAYGEMALDDYKPTSVATYYSHTNYTYGSPQVENPISYRYLSCFTAETPVWTDSGVRSIASIQVGDRVLAQDPNSGELTFAIVLAHTLRPPSEIMNLRIGGEEIACTKGHPFWVNGTGWKMAKLIKEGDAIHGLQGGYPVESITSAAWKDSAHNLVVDGHADYFVGKQAFLVHDNTYRAPTRAVIPGYIEAVEVATTSGQ